MPPKKTRKKANKLESDAYKTSATMPQRSSGEKVEVQISTQKWFLLEGSSVVNKNCLDQYFKKFIHTGEKIIVHFPITGHPKKVLLECFCTKAIAATLADREEFVIAGKSFSCSSLTQAQADEIINHHRKSERSEKDVGIHSFDDRPKIQHHDLPQASSFKQTRMEVENPAVCNELSDDSFDWSDQSLAVDCNGQLKMQMLPDDSLVVIPNVYYLIWLYVKQTQLIKLREFCNCYDITIFPRMVDSENWDICVTPTTNRFQALNRQLEDLCNPDGICYKSITLHSGKTDIQNLAFTEVQLMYPNLLAICNVDEIVFVGRELLCKAAEDDYLNLSSHSSEERSVKKAKKRPADDSPVENLMETENYDMPCSSTVANISSQAVYKRRERPVWRPKADKVRGRRHIVRR